MTPLRYLADATLTGRRAVDIDELIDRIAHVSRSVREAAQALATSEITQQQAATTVRAHANGPQARKVEEAEDPRVVDLIMRLRADAELPSEAERLAGHLEQRAVSLRDDLDRHDHDVRTCATMLHVQAARAIERLRAYQNQSRPPDGLGDWSQRRFVIIEHERVPDDEPVAIDRVSRVVHALLTPGAGRSDAPSLLFAAARALVSLLDPDGRGGRRHVDDVAAAIRRLVSHIDAAEVPQLVGDTIRCGEEQGRWSATRTTTVRRGHATLPKALTLSSGARATARRLRPVAPLRDELARWAANLRLSPPQRQLLVAVNEWLRRTDGGNVPMVAAAERAYELIGDEKAFDSWPPRGGAILWGPGRLTFELLRCAHTPTPLTWEPATSRVGVAGPIICVENHATFRTLLRVMRTSSSPRWVAVAWVQGRNTAPLESLADLPFRITRLDYVGDLDPAGLAIAAAACATAKHAGVLAGSADRLWALLLDQPTRVGRKVDEIDALRLVGWLPEQLRERASALLVAGRAISQEALRFDVVADVLD